jgi:tetratricopeptide (TPR) repeat protein
MSPAPGLCGVLRPAQGQTQQGKVDSRQPPDASGEPYFHFSMGRYFEELYETSGRSEDANQSIEHYKKAYALAPQVSVIGERLAEMYYKAQRIRDAVLELQEIIRREPENLSARRLLARIYLRTIGERTTNPGSRELALRATEQLREIHRLDPADLDAAQWLARLYQMQQEPGKAADVLRTALGRDPENPAILRQLAQALMEAGKADEALALLEKATESSPQPATLVLLGDAAMQVRDYERAVKAFERAIQPNPRDTETRRKLARALIHQNRAEEALEQYRKLIEIEPEEADHYLRAAQLLRQLRRLDQAEEFLLRARQRAPGNLEVLYSEAVLYEDQGRFEDAIRVLSSAVAAVKATPARFADSRRTLAVLYERLGMLYRSTENFPAALSTFQEILPLGPEAEKRARSLIAETYRDSKDIARAIAESQKALDAFPDDRSLRVTHALLLGENGETERAVALLRETVRGDASDRETWIALAQVLERGRRFGEAESAVRNAEKLSKTESENEGLWLLLGAIYERQNKWDLAEEQFQRVLKLNPRNAQALNYFGYMLADRGVRLDEAVALIRRALEEEPHNGAYLDSLGWAYFKQGRLEEAETYLRRAAERSSLDPTIREHLGDLYLRTGRPELAAREWERSLAEWRRALPAERDEDRVAEIERKLSGVKKRLAQKSAPEARPR